MSDNKITREWLVKFDKAISVFHIDEHIKSGIDPIIAQAMLDGLKVQRDELRNKLKPIDDTEPWPPVNNEHELQKALAAVHYIETLLPSNSKDISLQFNLQELKRVINDYQNR